MIKRSFIRYIPTSFISRIYNINHIVLEAPCEHFSQEMVGRRRTMKKFWKDEGGAVATEYAVITTIIALGIVVGTTLFATGLNNWFSDAGSELDTVTIPDVP